MLCFIFVIDFDFLFLFIFCDKYSGQRIGSEPLLPYLSPQLNGQRLLVGANFASAGIGILNDTGIQFVSTDLCRFFYFIIIQIWLN